jgi:branched-chain amino acid transport system permease protein
MNVTRTVNAGLLALAVVAAGTPFLVDTFSVWELSIRICYFLLLVLGWNLISGHAGLFSFGHVAFAALGAYASGILSVELEVPVPLAALAGAAFAGMLGLVLGGLSLRIGGAYLVVVSFAFLRVVEITIQAQREVTGGVGGLVVPRLFTGADAQRSSYLIGLVLVVGYLVAQHLVMRSHWRHLLFALRDNEYAAAAMGGRPRVWKLVVFAASSAVAGLAGAFLGHSVGFIVPNMGGLGAMSMVVAIGIVGGLGSTYGPVAAGILLLVMDSQLRATASGLSAVLFGLVLLAVVVAVPGGLASLGNRFVEFMQGIARRKASADDVPTDTDTDTDTGEWAGAGAGRP